MSGLPGKRNYLGEVRRSQIIGYGPGAIIDFRAGSKGGGPVSVVAASLDSWNQTATLEENDPHLLFEPRLQKVLDKSHFRQPPIDDSDPEDSPERHLRGYRFPSWLICPECNRLDYSGAWGKTPGDAARWCEVCSINAGRRVFAVPTRFVTACVNGHLDEFPWHYWIRRAYLTGRGGNKPECLDASEDERRPKCKFRLFGRGGSGLESLFLECGNKNCKARTAMAGIFDQEALKGLSCSGRRPWIEGDARETCEETPRALQRGASNLYFPVTYSVLSIPPWTGDVFAEIGAAWATLRRMAPELRKESIEAYAEGYAGRHGMTKAEYTEHVKRLFDDEEDVNHESIRPQEYLALKARRRKDDPNFSTKSEKVPALLADHISSLVRVRRLREVRALLTFKRIQPPVDISNPGTGKFGEICDPNGPVDWLPAIEVLGEGIFIELSKDLIQRWLSEQPKVVERVEKLNEEYRAFLQRLTGQEPQTVEVTPTEVLVHSFSHTVIKRLAFEAGYDAASLRERLFVSNDPWMAGVLIYTATADADGTLGGLERQGQKERVENLVLGAVRDVEWCASDPLCRRGITSTSEALNLSACHNCLFLPETSCEKGNRLLDRTLLVGDEEESIEGFFDDLLVGR